MSNATVDQTEDGELSDGELPSEDEEHLPDSKEITSSYALFSSNNQKSKDLQKSEAHEEADEFDDDMAMDPYSDYQAPSKAERSERQARTQLSPEYAKDFTNGEHAKNGHESKDGIARIDEREEHFRSFVRTDDRPNLAPFGIQQQNDTVEPEPTAKGKFGKARHEKTRRKRNASDEFLKELSNYERIKDIPQANAKKKKKSYNNYGPKYYDHDNPPKSNNHHDDFSDDDGAATAANESAFRSRFNENDQSDGASDSERHQNSSNGLRNPATIFNDDRPIIIDERRRSPSRFKAQKRKNDAGPRIVDHRVKSGFERKDHRRGTQKSPWPARNGARDDNKKSERNDKKAQNEENLRKYELCKYYIAGTCLKGERCHYMHKNYPCKYYHISKSCQKKNCLFSHDDLTAITANIIEKLQSDYFLADDSAELEFIKDNGVEALSKPPPGVPLLPTPPGELICEKFIGKVDATVRPMVPLPGETWPAVIDYEPYLTQETHAKAENVMRNVLGISIGEDIDVTDETSAEVGTPNPDVVDADSIGWIMYEWHNKTEPVPMTGKKIHPNRFSPTGPGPIKPLGSPRRYDDRSPPRDNSYNFPPIRKPLGLLDEEEEERRRYGMDPRDRLTPPPFMRRDHDDRSLNPIVQLQEKHDRYDSSPDRYDRYRSRSRSRSPERSGGWKGERQSEKEKYGFSTPSWARPPSRSPSPQPYKPRMNDDGQRRWPNYDSYERGNSPQYSPQGNRTPTLDDDPFDEPQKPRFGRSYSPPPVQSRLDEAQRDLIQNYDEPYVPKPRNHHVRDTIEGVPSRPYRRPSMPEPRQETCHIPTQVSREVQDPRPHLPAPAKPPSDLPIPDLIDLVDFRVTFTINGVPYQMPNDIITEVVAEKPKLPNLAPLPMLNQQSPKTSVPVDPRRRSVSAQSPSSSAADHPLAGLSGNTPMRKKISLSDYRKKSDAKPDTSPPVSRPIFLYGNQT